MVRVGPVESEALVASTQATVVEMRGRPMPGWLRVAPEHVSTSAQLDRWVQLGVSYARSLPAKANG
jgi:hypothetical protein